MPHHVERLEFAPPESPGLFRALVLALLVHGALILALTWGVHWQRDTKVIHVEAELWSELPQAAESPPPPPPLLEVQPTPPKADIAIEQEHPKPVQEPQHEKTRKIQPEKPKPATKVEKTTAKDRHANPNDKSRLNAKAIELQRQKNLQRLAGMANATGNSQGNAAKSSGPSANYASRIRARIRPNIVFTDEVPGNPTAEVEVRTLPDGTIVGRRLSKSSGFKSWDDAVLKAIDKTEVLPRDTDGKIISPMTIVFSLRD